MNQKLFHKLSSVLFFAVPESCKSKSDSVNDPFFLRALEGFLLVVSADGDMIFLSENINEYLGITQVCSNVQEMHLLWPSFSFFDTSQSFHFIWVLQALCLSVLLLYKFLSCFFFLLCNVFLILFPSWSQSSF